MKRCFPVCRRRQPAGSTLCFGPFFARRCFVSLLLLALCLLSLGSRVPAGEFRLARFSADITIPLGHRCMGILPTKSQRIVDPLYAHGFVLLGGDKPVVLCALDWCEVRNGAYDQWRDALGKAAGTTRERVLVSSLHQHDAPVTDLEAQQLLNQVGLKDELYDPIFHQATVQRVAQAVTDSLETAVPVSHLGFSKTKVKRIASNRRVEHPDGRVSFSRGSSSGRNEFHREASEGLIDPWLRTITFYHQDKPLLCLHAYATHPMSYYGRGGVTSDFVGLAREQLRREDSSIQQIYVSGCSGDVTAGKYNDGSQDARRALTQRMYEAMKRSISEVQRVPLTEITFRNTTLELPFNDHPKFQREVLTKTLRDDQQDVRERILAAMALSSLDRIDRGQPIDVPCLDLGEGQIVLLPGEAFVGYQLMAQQLSTDPFVLTIGYGECWPGYIPTRKAFDEGFGHSWRWVAPGSEPKMRAALQDVLLGKE